MNTPFMNIGEAQTESAFLTSTAGFDVARLERITPDLWPDLENQNYLSDEAWQETIDLVDAAPKMKQTLYIMREVLSSAESELERMEAATGHPCDPSVILAIRKVLNPTP